MTGRRLRRRAAEIVRAVELVLIGAIIVASLLLAALVGVLVLSAKNGATPDEAGRRAGGEEAARHGQPPGEGARARHKEVEEVLCAEPDELSYAGGDGPLAAAADENGHFTLYGRPDPQTGRPTVRSPELLGGCNPQLSFANYASVRVEGGPADGASAPAGASNLLSPTGKTADGTLVTAFRFEGGLMLRQELRLVRGRALEISYRLENVSSEGRAATVRALLSPAVANEGQRTLFRVPGLDGRPAARGGVEDVWQERNLLAGAGQVGAVYVPRPAASGDSSGLWTPAGGRTPERVTFAGLLELSSAPMLYGVRPGWPLPPNAAIAVYWQDVRLPPGGSAEFSHEYALPSEKRE
ncbi:MAG: hypothetical protein AB1425_00925 [Actinomycetota bacterium]